MARFHFCVSLLSEVMSGNHWRAYDNPDGRSVEAALTRCLRSILNQSCPDFVVHVAYHEMPPVEDALLTSPHVVLHAVDFPRPPDMDLATYNRLSGKVLEKLPDVRRRRIGDKYSKLKVGLNAAFADVEASAVMFVDHDDLVHRDVVDYTLNTGDGAPGGHTVHKGYSYAVASGLLREVDGFQGLCGTCNAVRLADWEKQKWATTRDVNVFSDTWENRRKHWLFAGHAGVHKSLTKEGRRPTSFPFRAAVYVTGTGANYSGTQRAGSGQVPLTDELRQAFALS